MRRCLRVVALAAALLAGCARPQPPAEDVVQPAPEPAPEAPLAATPAAAASAEPAAPSSPPRLTILAPTERAVLPTGQPVEVKVAAADALTARVLVALDQRPPKVVANLTKPISLGKLPEGPHLLRLVPCDAAGLSCEPGQLVLRSFAVGPGEGQVAGFNPAGPVLTLGQPTDPVALADTGEVPFEFRVDGAPIGPEQAKVKWQVDGGATEYLAEYPAPEPLTLGRLEPGRHKVTVWLEGPDGKPLTNAGYTRVERAFQVPQTGSKAG